MTEPTDICERVRRRYPAAATRSAHGEHDQGRALDATCCAGPPVTTTDAQGRVVVGSDLYTPKTAEGAPEAAVAASLGCAPYEVALARVLMALACPCRTPGDNEGARLELEAAPSVFEQAGAAPDLARLDSPIRSASTESCSRLTPRELEVLHLVAAGGTNKAIAAELVLSKRTVDRHVSNILTKLGVPSRTAATAYAYQHQLAEHSPG